MAEQRVIAEQDAVTEPAAATETQSVAPKRSAATIKMVEAPTLIEEFPSNPESVEVTNVQPKVKVEEYTQPAVAAVQKTEREAASTMSMEDFLNVEEKKRKPRRRLTAAVYAAGMVSTNALISNDLPVMQGDYTFSNDAKPGASLGSSTGFVSADSGISYNPETPLESNHFQYYTNSPGPDMNHSRPVSAGVALSLPLNEHLFLESGLYYSYLHSTSHAVSDQSLHFIGIPVKAGWRMGMSHRTSLSFSAGAKAEKWTGRDSRSLASNWLQSEAQPSNTTLPRTWAYSLPPSFHIGSPRRSFRPTIQRTHSTSRSRPVSTSRSGTRSEAAPGHTGACCGYPA